MVLILQLGRLDLLKLLRQGRHDGIITQPAREKSITRKKKCASCLPSKEEDRDRIRVMLKIKIEESVDAEPFFFFLVPHFLALLSIATLRIELQSKHSRKDGHQLVYS